MHAAPELSGLKTALVSLHRDHGVAVIQMTSITSGELLLLAVEPKDGAHFYFAHRIKYTWQLRTWHESYIAVTTVSHLLSCEG